MTVCLLRLLVWSVIARAAGRCVSHRHHLKVQHIILQYHIHVAIKLLQYQVKQLLQSIDGIITNALLLRFLPSLSSDLF